MEIIDRYQQGFNDCYHCGEPDSRLVDIPEYMAGFAAANTRCNKPFEKQEENTSGSKENTSGSED